MLIPLDAVQFTDERYAYGTDDIVATAQGTLMMTTADGKILEYNLERDDDRVVARLNGLPVGLHVVNEREVLVCDAVHGLFSIDLETGIARLLCNEAEGQRVNFAMHVTQDSNGTIYFTDASRHPVKPIVEGGSVYDLGDSIMQRIIAGDASGRVIRLDKEMNSDGTERWHATVILRDLAVPTGIGMGREDELLLISESGRFSLLHHPLTPPQKDEGDALPKLSPLFRRFPAVPLSIRRTKDGFWVALPFFRTLWLEERMQSEGWMRSLLVMFQQYINVFEDGTGFAFIPFDGTPVPKAFVDDDSLTISRVSGVVEMNGLVYLSALSRPYLSFVPIS